MAAAAARGRDEIPGFVREPLDVVRQVAGQIDDGGAEAFFGSEAGSAEPFVDPAGEGLGGNPAEPHDGPGLVEGPLRADHLLHQARLGSREHVADLALLLHRGAQRLLDAAAVVGGDRLELVERDREPPVQPVGQPRRQREDVVGEPRGVLGRAHGGERHRHAAAGEPALDAHFRRDAREQFAEPRSRPPDARFDREQRPRVALEKGDVRAEAGDGHLDRGHLLLRQRIERLADERRLPVPPRRDQEDFLAVAEIGDQAIQFLVTVGEGRARNDLTVDKRILHTRRHRILRQRT